MSLMITVSEMFNTMLVFSTALIFAAIGGLISEKSGVINIGLEGLMIAGAFASAVAVIFAEDANLGGISPWLGLLAGLLFGTLFSLIHAVAAITFRANQVVTGVVINFLALGTTVYLVKLIYGTGETRTLKEVFTKIHVPFLSDIPILGKALFVAYPTTYIALALVAAVYYVIYKTPFGLRLRAVGEHPGAVDTIGVNVPRLRYIAVMLSGALAGLGGATITLTTTSNFTHNSISGQGFIALAALIFGKWNPVGAMVAAMFFGIAQTLKNQIQLFPFADQIPTEFIFMFPYVLTILVLIGAVGRANPPSALGETYYPGKR